MLEGERVRESQREGEREVHVARESERLRNRKKSSSGIQALSKL